MHQTSERIKSLMEIRGVKNAELARIIGASRSTVTKWFTENTEPKASFVQKIADSFDVPIDYFYSKTPEMWVLDKREPVYNVAAGEGAYNGTLADKIADDIINNMREPGEYSYVEVHGDSMLPEIKDGDILTVHHQYETFPNDYTVVKVDGEHATVKFVERVENGVWLRALNKEVYPDKFFSVKEIMTLPVTIIGKVVKIERQL